MNIIAMALLQALTGSAIAGVDLPVHGKVPDGLITIHGELQSKFGIDSCSASLDERRVFLFPPEEIEVDGDEVIKKRAPRCGAYNEVQRVFVRQGEAVDCNKGVERAIAPAIDAGGCNYSRYAKLSAALSPGAPLTTDGVDHRSWRDQFVVMQSRQAALLAHFDSMLEHRASIDDEELMQLMMRGLSEYQAVTDAIFDAAREDELAGSGVTQQAVLAQAFELAQRGSVGLVEASDRLLRHLDAGQVLEVVGKRNLLRLSDGTHAATTCSQPYYCESILARAHIENREVFDGSGRVHDNLHEPLVVYRTTLDREAHLAATLTLTRTTVCAHVSAETSTDLYDELIMQAPYHYYRSVLTKDNPIAMPKCIVAASDMIGALGSAQALRAFFAMGKWSREQLLDYEQKLKFKCLRGPAFAFLEKKYGRDVSDQWVESYQRLLQSVSARALEDLGVVHLADWAERGQGFYTEVEQLTHGQVRSFYPQYVNIFGDAIDALDAQALIGKLRDAAGTAQFTPISENWWHLGVPTTRSVNVRFKFAAALKRALEQREDSQS